MAYSFIIATPKTEVIEDNYIVVTDEVHESYDGFTFLTRKDEDQFRTAVNEGYFVPELRDFMVNMDISIEKSDFDYMEKAFFVNVENGKFYEKYWDGEGFVTRYEYSSIEEKHINDEFIRLGSQLSVEEKRALHELARDSKETAIEYAKVKIAEKQAVTNREVSRVKKAATSFAVADAELNILIKRIKAVEMSDDQFAIHINGDNYLRHHENLDTLKRKIERDIFECQRNFGSKVANEEYLHIAEWMETSYKNKDEANDAL